MNNKLWWWFVFCYLSFPCSFLLIWIVGAEHNRIIDEHYTEKDVNDMDVSGWFKDAGVMHSRHEALETRIQNGLELFGRIYRHLWNLRMSITYFEPTVKLIGITQPLIKREGSTLTPEESRNGVSAGDAVLTAEQFVVYVARVSNPSNKTNTATAPKLIKYLLDHGHFSPFELVNLVFEIETTRDISRQILRHEFRPQEFSQRYAEVDPDLPIS